MPVVLRTKGYKFYFFSDEGDEPIHIHVNKADADAKIWLEPKIKTAYFYGFNPGEIKQVKNIVTANIDLFKTAWNEYFKGK